MDTSRWDRVKEVFDLTLERAPQERAVFLRQTCGEDHALMSEVASLLVADERAGNFVEGPAIDALAAAGESDVGDRVLQSGERLGSFEITAFLAAGGMGEVYRALDTRLGRDVAIKTLPHFLTSDPERLARLQREARLLAALNHPHIAAIYGMEEADGVIGLVLELVDGETLQERLKRGPLPVVEALAVGRQIADALESAHEHGIVHRDLKPANIKVRADGTAKVLDFGLAKALGDEAAVDPAMSPTLTAMAMRAGVIMGTAAYMSPEQARGQPFDKRTDIWAFGCVLYEMLTGQRAFKGEGITDVLLSVVEKEPDWTRLPAELPAPIAKLLRRCLEKDRRQRLPDIGVARQELEESQNTKVDADLPSPSVPEGAGVRRAAVLVLPAFVAGIVIAAIATWMWTRPSPPRALRFTVSLPTTDSLAFVGRPGPGPVTALSPDGSTLIYVATRNGVDQFYRRPLNQVEAVAIPDTEGARHPFFSPDGRWVGFLASGPVAPGSDTPDRKLKKISLAGGPATTICDISLDFFGASWGSDDRIVFSSGRGLSVVPAAGGMPESLTTLERDETAHRWPHVLPDGDGIVFTSALAQRKPTRVVALSLKTGERRQLLEGTSPRYSPTGHLLFARGASLWAVPFDTKQLRLTGDPAPLVEGVRLTPDGSSDFALAADALAYLPGAIESLSYPRTLVWVDREGREDALKAPPRAYVSPRISPDGTKVALDILDEERDIWIWDFAREVLTRLTFDPGPNRSPVWTPDGRRVAFSAVQDEREQVYWQAADGIGTAERLVESPTIQVPTSFSPDGKWLVAEPVNGPFDMGIVNLEGERRAAPLLNASFEELNGVISPDGRWLAYQSNESGRREIYVRPFPNVNAGRWQISSGGGERPLWARNGRELFYFVPARAAQSAATPVRRLMSVDIHVGPNFVPGNPRILFEGQYFPGPVTGRPYDVSPDGKRFLIIKQTPQVTRFIVVLHWFEELKRLVPKNSKN